MSSADIVSVIQMEKGYTFLIEYGAQRRRVAAVGVQRDHHWNQKDVFNSGKKRPRLNGKVPVACGRSLSYLIPGLNDDPNVSWWIIFPAEDVNKQNFQLSDV